eukprot:NODE_18_length_3562_cov_135.645602_g14_i0.p1 GENE.NODE_18_length_3562_cov_135.645602_g14_i0~~NODE_18_length_3562_cov_135.645602_g14_i0.p1  ORF type:complete len:733 (+),score=94.04 NODE_18_length_3562_cov_135.645602_g14_i0:764-2962(+)
MDTTDDKKFVASNAVCSFEHTGKTCRCIPNVECRIPEAHCNRVGSYSSSSLKKNDNSDDFSFMGPSESREDRPLMIDPLMIEYSEPVRVPGYSEQFQSGKQAQFGFDLGVKGLVDCLNNFQKKISTPGSSFMVGLGENIRGIVQNAVQPLANAGSGFGDEVLFQFVITLPFALLLCAQVVLCSAKKRVSRLNILMMLVTAAIPLAFRRAWMPGVLTYMKKHARALKGAFRTQTWRDRMERWKRRMAPEVQMSEFASADGERAHPDEEFIAQAGAWDMIPDVRLLVAAFLSQSLLRRMLSGEETVSLLKEMGSIPKKQKNLEGAFAWAVDMAQTAVTFLTRGNVRFDKRFGYDVEVLCDHLELFYGKMRKEGSICDNNFQDALSLRMRILQKMSQVGREDIGLFALLQIHHRKMEEHIKNFEARNFHESGFRAEPVVALFKGKSGVGKSNAIKALINEFIIRTGTAEEAEQHMRNSSMGVYNRMHENDYWEGYHGQPVCVFDDFGQGVDVAGNMDNEFMNLIRCANSYPCHLHMADMERKANTYFRSKLILLTTNVQNWNVVKSLHEKQALLRRFTYTYEVKVKAEYTYGEDARTDGKTKFKHQIDQSKIPVHPVYGTKYINRDIYEFHKVRWLSESQTDLIAVLSWDEVMEELVTASKESSEFMNNVADHEAEVMAEQYKYKVERMKRERELAEERKKDQEEAEKLEKHAAKSVSDESDHDDLVGHTLPEGG